MHLPEKSTEVVLQKRIEQEKILNIKEMQVKTTLIRMAKKTPAISSVHKHAEQQELATWCWWKCRYRLWKTI